MSTTFTPGNFNFGNIKGLGFGTQNTAENQYGSGYPAPPTTLAYSPSTSGGAATPGSMPGAVPMPSGSSGSGSLPSWFTGAAPINNAPAGQQVPNAGYNLSHNQFEVPPADPSLQGTLFNYLQGQVGQGITPYNLQAVLPTGGTTAPGQVSAPLDPVTQQLLNFFTTGQSSNPNLNSLSQLAQTGDPIDQTPAWQAMVAAAQQQIQQGGNDVREQMAFTGNLPGSAGALGISNYYDQANLGLTSQLLTAQTAAQQQAVQNKLGASQALEGAQQTLGSTLYGIDQNSINALMQEYFQTTPQENPLNQEIFSGASTYAPTYGKSSTPGVGGAIASAIPGLASGAAAGVGAAGGGAGLIGSILAGLAGI